MSASLDFHGQAVIVTGAGNGLGRAYAHEFAARGAAVVVNDLGVTYDGYNESRSAADTVVAEITAAGGTAVASYDSVAVSDDASKIVQLAMDHFGRLDAVVNNAGILRNAKLIDLPDNDLDALVDVHLKGAFYVSRAAMEIMKMNSYGRLLFTASGSGVYGCQEQSAYGAAKAGLIGLMNVAALEGKADNILVNTIMPVAAVTRMSGDYDEQAMAVYHELFTPFEDAITPEFITPLVIYLSSRLCQSTKCIYSASGGRFARVFIGTGNGWYGPRNKPARAEDIATHFSKINDCTGWIEIADLLDEAREIGRHITAGA